MLLRWIRQLRQRLQDMHTIKHLCVGAERHALQQGQSQPGAEHFLLSALDLPDGSARRALSRLGVDSERLQQAIAEQHLRALRHIGLHVTQPIRFSSDLPADAASHLYQAQPSGQALMQRLAAERSQGPLLAAQVLIAIAAMHYGTAVRALQLLGIDGHRLEQAARAEMAVV